MLRLHFAKELHGSASFLSRSSPLFFRRAAITTFFRRVKTDPKVKVNDVLYDNARPNWGGKFLGIPADTIVYNSKLAGGIGLVVFTFYMFFKGYVWLAEFSLVTIARMGFIGGFITSAVLYTTALSLRRRYGINPKAVYNQSISLAMRNAQISEYLGPHPRTGDFKAYCASGGFKLPLARRLRSGSYELSDALGTKPRRLQMMFILRNPVNGREGLVTVDIQKESTGFLTSTDTFKSLAVTLSDTAASGDPKTVIIIGRQEDVVYRGLMKL